MRSFQKILLLFLLIALIFAIGTAGVSAAPEISAASAIVMDGDTGAIYYEKNADESRAPASMVKLITTYIILEEIEKGTITLDTKVPVSKAAANLSRVAGYSNVPLTAGDTHTVDEMLTAILLESANGAAMVMAEYLGGSESAFSARMDQVALNLGLSADFDNSHGLSGNRITARSMALFADHLIEKYPVILNYTSLKSFVFKGKTYRNRNEFIIAKNYYEGVDGLKTGSSNAAGKCITVSAKKNGRRLIVVVMGSTSESNRYSDARKLLDYGFSVMPKDNLGLKDASIDLIGEKEKIRIGADFDVSATVFGLNTANLASGGWTINGNVVSEFQSTAISNGTVLYATLNLKDYADAPVMIGFYFNLSDGTKKLVEKEFVFSNEVPCAFRDIDGHWAETFIAEMKETSVLSGYPDGTFGPDKLITREEFVTAFVRLLECFDLIEVVEGAESTFDDCKGDWAEDYIAAAQSAEIIFGRSDRIFDPKANITRQEITAIVARALNYTASGTETGFSDAALIHDWAYDSVVSCVEHQVLSGYPDGTFGPLRDAQRAEVATILARAYVQLELKNNDSSGGEESDNAA